MSTPISPSRFAFLDGLRGLAVLLMMEQNIGIWLWQSDGPMYFSRHPFLFSLNGVGGLAGPLFITLAGVGSVLFERRRTNIDRTLIYRGFGIMLFGYLMNFLTPGLFSMGSWFTLHMIGFAIMTTPIYRRLATIHLLLFIAVILIFTGGLHYYLHTPEMLSEVHMRNLELKGGIFRLMLVEGHYPVFPWLSFYLAGVVTGRLFVEKRISDIIHLSLLSILGGSLFLTIGWVDSNTTSSPFLSPFFRLNLGSFPTPPLFALIFFPVVALLFVFFNYVTNDRLMKKLFFLPCLGRISLSLQIIHVVIFYEVSQRLQLFRTFSTYQTLLILGSVLFFCAVIAGLWRKYDFKFSCEWILRRVVG